MESDDLWSSFRLPTFSFSLPSKSSPRSGFSWFGPSSPSSSSSSNTASRLEIVDYDAPPENLTEAEILSSGSLVISSEGKDLDDGKDPILFFINKRSGGTQGESVMQRVQELWPGSAIFLQDTLLPEYRSKGKHGPSHGSTGDLLSSHSSNSSFSSVHSADEATHILDNLKNMDTTRPFRLVSAGGDGTISWLANILLDLDIKSQPPIALLPLGTGNELARCLGWGPSLSPWISDLPRFRKCVQEGDILHHDCWKLTVHSDGVDDSVTTYEEMFCFFSLGFDAHIAYEFHCLREESPGVCSSVTGNKLIHTAYGAKQFFVPLQQLSDWISLRVDGVNIPVPRGCRTIQVLNIHSSADGTDFFGINPRNRFHATNDEDLLKEYKPPRPDDQLLEVVATDGVPHLLAIRMGATHSRRLAQGRHISIVYKHPTEPICMQLDGDPWLQRHCEVEITHMCTVPLVLGPLQKSGGL